MRYTKFFFAAAMVAIMFSCTKEMQDEQQVIQTGITEITASFADLDNTKTVLGTDGVTILWNPGDEISAFYNEIGLKFTALNSNPTACTVFASERALIYGRTENEASSYLYAAYPYSSSNAQAGELITLSVPSSQNAVEGSFGRGAFPSVGRSKDTNIAFYNVCGGIRFTLCQSGIRKIAITGNNNETIAGKVKVKFGESSLPEVSTVVDGAKAVTLVAPGGGEFQTGKWYYVSLLPVTFTNGFSVEFIKRTDESERGTRSFTSSREVKRSIFGSIDNVDSDVVFGVGVASLEIAPSSVLVAPMSAAQFTLTVLPSDATYEWIGWSSSDKTIATVGDDGMVVGKKDGKCTVTATSDNGKTASCTVYVSQTPVTTNDASDVGYFTSAINGSFNVTGAELEDKTVFFLYSDSESTLEGLKANGTRVNSSLSGSDFTSTLNSLEYVTKYYYVAAVTFLNQTYYGSINHFTTVALPEGPVDLGLSVKWASCNIGASNPMEYGRYFAWGDVVGQTWDGSKWSGGGFNDYPAYELDGNGNLKPEYDAARVILGGKWRMPTHAEQQELITNCTSTWTTINGVNGRLFTSKKTGYTDKSIFLPAAGIGDHGGLINAGSSGSYWSGTLYYGNYAWYISSYPGGVISDSSSRFHGYSVRPVSE